MLLPSFGWSPLDDNCNHSYWCCCCWGCRHVYSSRPGTVGIPRKRKLLGRKMCSNRPRRNRPMPMAVTESSLTTAVQILCGPSVETHSVGLKRVRSGWVFLRKRSPPEVRNASLTKIAGHFARVRARCERHRGRYRCPPAGAPMIRTQGNHARGAGRSKQVKQRLQSGQEWQSSFHLVLSCSRAGWIDERCEI